MLYNDRLNYYKTPSDATPLGSIPLEKYHRHRRHRELEFDALTIAYDAHASVDISCCLRIDADKKCCFELYNPDQAIRQRHPSYLIMAPSPQEMDSWVTALRVKVPIETRSRSLALSHEVSAS